MSEDKTPQDGLRESTTEKLDQFLKQQQQIKPQPIPVNPLVQVPIEIQGLLNSFMYFLGQDLKRHGIDKFLVNVDIRVLISDQADQEKLKTYYSTLHKLVNSVPKHFQGTMEMPK